MKPFDLQAALSGAKLVTRDGREVTGFKHDPCPRKTKHNYRAWVDGIIYYYTQEGSFYIGCEECENDLLLSNEAEPAAPKTRTMWVNIHKMDKDDIYYAVDICFETESKAVEESLQDGTYYATLPIEIPQP